MGVSWRHQNSSMALSILIALSLFATTFAERGCEDYYFSECHDPPAQQELHVGSLEECIQNCELFGSFGQCDYLLYFKSGPDENCKIISGPGEPDDEMNKYLDACRVAGQPMQNTAGDCLPPHLPTLQTSQRVNVLLLFVLMILVQIALLTNVLTTKALIVLNLARTERQLTTFQIIKLA